MDYKEFVKNVLANMFLDLTERNKQSFCVREIVNGGIVILYIDIFVFFS